MLCWRGLVVWIAIACAVATYGTGDESFAADSSGTASGNMVLQRYGTKDALNQNLSVPMTNSATPMHTVNGATSFTAASSVPSSKQFLQILIQPASTGDLSTVVVMQDLNGGGAFTNSSTLGMPVSGVCANGFISCTPGTWSNCQPYIWQSDNTGALSVAPTGITQLGGCYCINSSCGNALAWKNASLVLKDLGGGAVGAIHVADASVVISNVSTDTTTISYYGQLVRNATNAGQSSLPALASSPTVMQDQSYYNNWASLDAAKNNIATAQGSDPTSLYYQVVNGVGANTGGSQRSCTVKRAGVITSVPVASYSGTGSGGLCDDYYLYAQIKQVGNQAYSLELVDTGPYGLIQMHANCMDDPGGDHWHVMKVVQLPQDSGSNQVKLTKAQFALSNVGGMGCSSFGIISIDGIMQGFGNPTLTSAVCTQKGAQYITFDWSYLFEFSTDTYQETVSDDCTAFEHDPDCQLEDDVVDGVQVVTNFNGTGLWPLPTCNTYTGVVGPMNICRPWWYQQRTYMCKNKNQFDFSSTIKRFQQVVTTSTDNISNLTYTDYRQDANGNWTSVPSTIQLPGRDPAEECSKSCKVKRPKIETGVGVDGVNSSLRISNDSYDIMYMNCDTGSCPVQPGDIIVTDCSCIDDFGEAATMMQVVRQCGADSICSSGNKQLPP